MSSALRPLISYPSSGNIGHKSCPQTHWHRTFSMLISLLEFHPCMCHIYEALSLFQLSVKELRRYTIRHQCFQVCFTKEICQNLSTSRTLIIEKDHDSLSLVDEHPYVFLVYLLNLLTLHQVSSQFTIASFSKAASLSIGIRLPRCAFAFISQLPKVFLLTIIPIS